MLWCQGVQNIELSNCELIRSKVHRMITMYARPRQTDRKIERQTERQAVEQTDKHHGNNATIPSNERIAR